MKLVVVSSVEVLIESEKILKSGVAVDSVSSYSVTVVDFGVTTVVSKFKDVLGSSVLTIDDTVDVKILHLPQT
jgi:hypothetical protein